MLMLLHTGDTMEICVPEKETFKIYHDGSHPVATIIANRPTGSHFRAKASEAADRYTALRIEGTQKNISDGELKYHIRTQLLDEFPELENGIDDFMDKQNRRYLHNLHLRKKRFMRKARMNAWTHFVSITYDDKKHDEDSFRKSLKKCFSNLQTRHDWRYMGVFERGSANNRLHFHALVYIPEGEMIGTIHEVKDYNKKHGVLETAFVNDFFEDRFGRNDFEEINPMQLKFGDSLQYMLKYITKTDDRIFYSRHVPPEVVKVLGKESLAAAFYDFVAKFVLDDDILTSEDLENDPVSDEEDYPLIC